MPRGCDFTILEEEDTRVQSNEEQGLHVLKDPSKTQKHVQFL